MEVKEKKESRLMGRTELTVLFEGKSGTLTRKEAVKSVSEELKVEEARVGLLGLRTEAGRRRLMGTFHVYDSAETMKRLHPKYRSVRLLTKEEREALKQAKKKAEQPKAK